MASAIRGAAFLGHFTHNDWVFDDEAAWLVTNPKSLFPNSVTGVSSLDGIRDGTIRIVFTIGGFEDLHKRQFHKSHRWLTVLNANHLTPIDHSLHYKLSFWGECEEDQRNNIADFIKAMFFSRLDDAVDASSSSETSCLFTPALKKRFIRSLSKKP